MSVEPRMGVHRKSMETNSLLRKTELGKCKYTGATPDKPHEGPFGNPRIPDKEGAREVSMMWKEHVPDPDDKPGPNFVAMDKLANKTGLTTAPQHRKFQLEKQIPLKRGVMHKQDPPLPSDKNPSHVYGRPSWKRSVEEYRQTGDQPDMTSLVQGAFHHDWVKMNMSRQDVFAAKAEKIPPRPTKATLGVTKTQQEKYGELSKTESTWKMKKFANVDSRYFSPERKEKPFDHHVPAPAELA